VHGLAPKTRVSGGGYATVLSKCNVILVRACSYYKQRDKREGKQQRGNSSDSCYQVKVHNLPSKVLFISFLLIQVCSEKERKQEFRGGLCTCTFELHFYSRPIPSQVDFVRSKESTFYFLVISIRWTTNCHESDQWSIRWTSHWKANESAVTQEKLVTRRRCYLRAGIPREDPVAQNTNASSPSISAGSSRNRFCTLIMKVK
jgi:hypothetical protein